MVDLQLEREEKILLHATDVGRCDCDNLSFLKGFYLTNKNLICIYDKTAFFSSPKTIVDKIPLSDIKVISNKVYAEQIFNGEFTQLQITYKDENCEVFEFCDSEEVPKWKETIINTILGVEETKMLEIEEKEYEEQANFENNKSNPGEKVVRFCSYCGTKLDVGARFCKSCGEAVANGSIKADEPKQKKVETEESPIKENPTERKTVYEGKIYKCPHCGEIMKSFSASCPSCGNEIRGSRATTSVQELAHKLELIEAEQMPHFEEKKSVMKMVFGRDFNNEDELEEAQDRFDEQKANKKANLIINFSVPNTREDILEFMLLASSNINVKKGLDDEVTKAWLSKLEQVYEKARLLMGNKPDFAQIKYIYDKKKSEIKNRKFKGLAIASYIVGGYVILFSILALGDCAYGTFILLLLIGLGLLGLGTKFIMIYNRNKRDSI